MGMGNTGEERVSAQLVPLAAPLIRPIGVSLGLFTLAAGLGLLLRFAFVFDLPSWIDYRNLQHAHSHVALLGWLFGAFYLVIIGTFSLDFTRYRLLYWLLQVNVAGMAIVFPIAGYNPTAIALTTIHIILSYVFAYRVWHELRQRKIYDWPANFLRASLILLVLSSLGTWALGPIIAMGLKGSAWYYGSIQFYLHFQFNGWLVFALLAIAFQLLKLAKINFSLVKMQMFFWVLLTSALLTFALAVTWSTPHPLIFAVNSIGVLVQLTGLILLITIVRSQWQLLSSLFTRYTRTCLAIAGIALIIKILVQTAVAIPAIAEISYTIRNFVVGFIHLLMLGALSLFLIAIIPTMTGRHPNISTTWLFIAGVIATELILFGQGIALWAGWGFLPGYHLLLASFSALIFISVATITITFLRKSV